MHRLGYVSNADALARRWTNTSEQPRTSASVFLLILPAFCRLIKPELVEA